MIYFNAGRWLGHGNCEEITERLPQIKDIMELKPLRDLAGPGSHGSQSYTFLLMRKKTQPLKTGRNQGRRGGVGWERAINLSKEV